MLSAFFSKLVVLLLSLKFCCGIMFNSGFAIFMVISMIIIANIKVALCEGCHVNHEEKLLCTSFVNGYYNNISDLILTRYTNTSLYLNNIVKHVPNVESIVVKESNVSFLIGPTKDKNIISELIITNTTLKRLSENLLVNLPNLKVLDLRGNYLNKLPVRLKYHRNLESVFLSKNKWNCSGDLRWAADLDPKLIKDYNLALCYGQLYKEKPVFKVAHFLQNMQTECPDICTCAMVNVIRDLNTEQLHPIVSVNCSRKNLMFLPKMLPNYTKILHVEDNFISDLSPLVTEIVYKNLLELYLDRNDVTSIAILEGGHWLEKFRVLSLRNNKLSQLPVYALDHALEQNPNMPDAVAMHLADNPWRCDCAYTPYFQEMLMKYAQQIRDIDNVLCRYVQGDPNSLLPILSISRNAFCRYPNENAVKPLDLLNIILAVLIIVVLGKLAYDYYNFKRTGQLPWLVTKMP